ncbi:similar to Glutathione S-transferase A1 (GTH1) (HA subunit 1) (GST-epsilon) (GSTA1-1) (GST class-alpha) [Rattus norvegicus]|uniref:Similar to Glutathione S-transferase A1 (GTH1) (HA subunit 1) (GST-epsilon) (GSTA1-1) (GST class-alpha) n=1 Tax=Rattus norvegicus TaxID=10116 RepID=A6JJ98_RAT|nr:similar to Glutathione S-transferase A1 (GTH1) (HA subunit 1) (GST-epsilon) (GSTA1-1) (GST class-alpha) [Rattus norvegicus]
MAEKPLFHYDEARGRMESVRWLLAAAGVEYEEKFIHTNEDLEKLRSGKPNYLKTPGGVIFEKS